MGNLVTQGAIYAKVRYYPGPTKGWLHMRVLLASVLVALTTSFTTAQTVPPELQQAMDAIHKARASSQGEKWGEYATADYVFTHGDGRVHHRSEEMAEINASTPRQPSQREDVRLHWYGNDMVIVTSKFVGQPTRAMDVWVRQSGQWKIAAAQSTPILQSKPSGAEF